MTIADLQRRIEAQRVTIGVVGLGYVGLPVACKFAEAGFAVHGLERQADKVNLINAGVLPLQGKEPGLAELLTEVVTQRRLIASTDPQIVSEAEVMVVAVETPVNPESRVPEYEALRAAVATLGKLVKPGTLVIIESTIAPGTTDNVVRPLLEEASGLKVDRDIYLGHCPERVMPGRLLSNLASMSRVCGGRTPDTSRAMAALYRHIVQADLDLTDCVTAEMAKTAENAYRDVQIAFANEIALICEAVGADVWRVRELVNKSPERNLHLPGAGVGGHCIPKDPWLLVHATNGNGYLPRLIPAARELNDSMPGHVARLLVDALTEVGCEVRGARIAVLGYAYLENSDDTRNTPTQLLVARLEELGAEVIIHDPYVPAYQGEVTDAVLGADALVIMVRHDEYAALDLARLKSLLNHPVLVDGRRVFEPADAQQAGLVFRGIGRGQGSR